jgi:hypothetical protein
MRMSTALTARRLRDIADEIESLEPPKDTTMWKERYDFLLRELMQIREDAEELRDDMKANGLTVSTIEAEGYLRCAITVNERIKYVEEMTEMGS